MSYVSVKDFGDVLGIKGVTVRQRINRGKLVKTDSGLIDVKNPINFSAVVDVNGGDLRVFDKYYKYVESDTNIQKEITPPNKSLEKKEEVKVYHDINDELIDLDLRKKRAETSLVERKSELTQYELEKKAGNTLPVNMIEKIISINFKAIYKSIKAQTKNIATTAVQRLGGEKEDLDYILIELDNILEKTVKDAQAKSEMDLERLIDEYSEIRSRGERKV